MRENLGKGGKFKDEGKFKGRKDGKKFEEEMKKN